MSGGGCQIESVSVEADAACIAMNFSRAKARLAWEPKIPVREGLRELVHATLQTMMD
jgi:nucleoside-diphosphate-sugar epimerase